jgi:hypothetical protein
MLTSIGFDPSGSTPRRWPTSWDQVTTPVATSRLQPPKRPISPAADSRACCRATVCSLLRNRAATSSARLRLRSSVTETQAQATSASTVTTRFTTR